MSAAGYAYIAGGAGHERTMHANRAAFDRVQIVPRRLRGAAVRNPEVELFGRTLRAPVLLAPVGVLEMAHKDADAAVSRAAAAEGVTMIFSSQASRPMEECAARMGDAPRWFQLYMSTSRELVASFVRRAEQCGCEAIVVTVDTTMLGWRVRDLDLAYLPFLTSKGMAQYVTDPVFQRLVDEAAVPETGAITPAALRTLWHLARSYPGSTWRNLRSRRPRQAVQTFIDIFVQPSLCWEDVDYVRDLTTLPVLLKGILHPDDASAAVSHGIDGIVVSNHGGRQIDGEVGALDMLPRIVEAIEGRLPILFDSGIRGGADIFKALALGAHAVLLGRPYCYGLAIAGEEGVREVIRNSIAELDLTMGLAGCASVAEVSAGSLTVN